MIFIPSQLLVTPKVPPETIEGSSGQRHRMAPKVRLKPPPEVQPPQYPLPLSPRGSLLPGEHRHNLRNVSMKYPISVNFWKGRAGRPQASVLEVTGMVPAKRLDPVLPSTARLAPPRPFEALRRLVFMFPPHCQGSLR